MWEETKKKKKRSIELKHTYDDDEERNEWEDVMMSSKANDIFLVFRRMFSFRVYSNGFLLLLFQKKDTSINKSTNIIVYLPDRQLYQIASCNRFVWQKILVY